MFDSPAIYFEGKRYVLVRDFWAGQHEGRKLSGHEALWLLERMLRDVNAYDALRRAMRCGACTRRRAGGTRG